MNITDNARVVLERRIGAKDGNGNPLESAEDIFRRVARNLAEAERNYIPDDNKEAADFIVGITEEKFYGLMSSMDFLPNSPTLVNAGRELQQLSACFVLPVEDSMEGIFESVKQAALIHKTGGGTGFSFSRLRAANAGVSATSGIASGPVSFMQVFDKATEVIKQGGTRRGANMGILRVDHPDILEFIHIKDDLTKLNNFNISVAITDKFMLALTNNSDYELIDPRTGEVCGTLNSRDVFNQIVKSAHSTGDPGVIFIDRINSGKANPVPHRGPIEATNPCGEQPLYPWDSCNLGSINLANFVTADGRRVDLERLSEVVHDAVHFLDNVIDMNAWPNEMIAETSTSIRRIGLGVMGWADLLIKLKIPYDSEEAIELAEKVMNTVQSEADKASIVMGMKRGNFPDFAESMYGDTYPALRHSTRTTIAPTGTISIIAGCSSGIEPLFALRFTRSHFLDKNDPNKRLEMEEFHPALAEWLDTVQDKNTPLPAYLRTAQEIDPEWHVRMQAVFQKYTDNAVSKTINFRKEATIGDIELAYLRAYTLGCAGITVYRDGARELQVLSVSKPEPKKEVLRVEPEEKRKKLTDTRNSINHKFSVGDFEGYINVGLYSDGSPGEVFIIGNRTGSTTRGYLDSLGLLFSLALQYGSPLDKITEKLTGTRFEPSGITGNRDIPVATSVIDYIARWLRREFIDKGDHIEYTKEPTGDMCPECDSPLFYGSGCSECIACGYSKCG